MLVVHCFQNLNWFRFSFFRSLGTNSCNMLFLIYIYGSCLSANIEAASLSFCWSRPFEIDIEVKDICYIQNFHYGWDHRDWIIQIFNIPNLKPLSSKSDCFRLVGDVKLHFSVLHVVHDLYRLICSLYEFGIGRASSVCFLVKWATLNHTYICSLFLRIYKAFDDILI